MATNYITIHDLAETTSGNVSEDAEFIINNGTDAVVATKAKLSSILAETKADIANLDGDIANVEADVIELQNDKMNIDHSNDSKPYIVETYDDGNGNVYRLWSDKTCEQWGYYSSSSVRQSWGNITLLKEYKDTNYLVFVSPLSAVRSDTQLTWMNIGSGRPVSTTNFYGGAYGISEADRNLGFYWYTKGEIA